jgi:hypothetical protein
MLLAMKGFEIVEFWTQEENLEFETQISTAWDQYFRLFTQMCNEIEKKQ